MHEWLCPVYLVHMWCIFGVAMHVPATCACVSVCVRVRVCLCVYVFVCVRESKCLLTHRSSVDTVCVNSYVCMEVNQVLRYALHICVDMHALKTV